MGFTNFLTSYRMHLLKHIRSVFTFQDTRGLTEPEIKAFVQKLTGESAVPIPSETFEWLGNYFRYVKDRESLLVYDNTDGLWHFNPDDAALQSVLTDFFTITADEAATAHDEIMRRYAQYFFTSGRIPTLAKRVTNAIVFAIRKSTDVMEKTEHLRYFETTGGQRALLDMSKPKFNLRTVKFDETQPMLLMHISPAPISTVDTPPKLWLSLIEEYMLHDPARIEYFHKVLAYMMAPYNYNQTLLYFIGSGRNGKSTIIKVLQDILGSHAVRMNAELLNSQPSPSFKKDDALAATEGKSLLIFNEIDERMVASMQNIKDLTEGGRDEFGNKLMTVVRPAYSKNYDVNVCGIPVIIANSLINFGDWSALDPVFRRLVLVPFEYKIQVEDPTILNRLAQEYPQIQAWLYMNYFKYKGVLIKTEPKPTAIENMFTQYREDSDIIQLFWNECIVRTGRTTDEMLRSDLYRMYVQYTKVNGRMTIKNKGTNGFQNMIAPYVNTTLGVVVKNGSYFIQGVQRSAYFDKEINHI